MRRLFEIAHGHSGSAATSPAFLIGLYGARRFPFDMTRLRCLDRAIFEACLAVLRMDYQPADEVHTYFPNGGEAFERLARDWGIRGGVGDTSRGHMIHMPRIHVGR